MAGLWRLVFAGAEMGPFTGRGQVDRMVDGLRERWAAGDLETGVVTVQINDGRGWTDVEVIDFAHEDEEGNAA